MKGKIGMNYCFDVDVAKEYGVEEAIVIYNFQFWINKNIANKTNFKNGHYWTYNSVDALNKLFPFWSSGQIRRIIKSLVDKEILLKEKLDCNKYNQTCWYAFKNEQKWICNSVNIDLLISANGDDENNKCKTDINQIKNKYICESLKSENELFGGLNDITAPREQQAVLPTQNSAEKKNSKGKLLPEGWYPKESTIAKLKEKGVIVDKAIDKFINSCIAKGYKYVDFDRAILSWDWEKNGLVIKGNNVKTDNELRAKL